MDKKWLQRKQQLIPLKEDLVLLEQSDPTVQIQITAKKSINDMHSLHAKRLSNNKMSYSFHISSNDLFGDITQDMKISFEKKDDKRLNDAYYYNVL